MPLLFTPQPHYRTSLRDQYLHQLTQEANRSRYFADPDDFFYARRPSYEEIQEARAREYYRRQAVARQAEFSRREALEQYRQHQLQLEQERRRKQHLADLERRRYLNSIRRDCGWTSEQSDFEEDQDEEQHDNIPAQVASPPVRIVPDQPSPEKMAEAASVIQSHYRAHLARRSALKALSSIRTAFNDQTVSFVFPSKPSFDSSLDSSSYKLSFNSVNVPIHGFEDALMKLLAKLDNVESNGDLIVRKERKKLARDIEAELSRLDRKKEEAWEAYRVENQLELQQKEGGSELPESPVTLDVEMEQSLKSPLSLVRDTGLEEVEGMKETQEKLDVTNEVPISSVDSQDDTSAPLASIGPEIIDNNDHAIIADSDMDDVDSESILASLFATEDQTPSLMASESKESDDEFIVVDPELEHFKEIEKDEHNFAFL